MNEKLTFYGIGRARNGEHNEYINHVLRIFTDVNTIKLNIQQYHNYYAEFDSVRRVRISDK